MSVEPEGPLAPPPLTVDFDAAVAAPFRMRPGLRRIAAGVPQFTPLVAGARHQREKLAVLSAFAADALCATPGFDAGPALRAVASQAAAEHPAHWRGDGSSGWAAPRLGVAVDHHGAVRQHRSGDFGTGEEVARTVAALAPPWRLAGLLALTFAEDLALLQGGEGRLPWLAVTLPSHWAPTAKVGRPFAQVHAPVADADALRAASAPLVALVTDAASPARWERFVWTVTDHPRLHAHPARVDPVRWRDPDPARAWWRSERQTFIPLPGDATTDRQAVFTIAVDVAPLAAVVAVAGRSARLHAALASMSDAVLAYRALTPVRGPLLAWLAARAADDEAAAARHLAGRRG